MNTPTTFPPLYLAESMEATPVLADAAGLVPPSAETVHHSVVVEGVFSTYANAEAALDMRNSRFYGAVPAEQFKPHGTRMWKRDMESPVPGATCWQTITQIQVDAHTS